MSIGTAIQIIESIITIYCGVILSVQHCPMRSSRKTASKILFWIFIIAGMAGACAHTFWFKFSSVYITALAIYLFIILFSFYYIPFLKLFIRNFGFWYTIMLCRYVVVCLGCMSHSTPFLHYISASYHEPFYPAHIICMLVTMGIALLAVHKTKKKPYIIYYSKNNYIWMLSLLLCQIAINEIFFRSDNLNGIENGDYSIICALIFWGLICELCIFLLFRLYLHSVRMEQLFRFKRNCVQKEYDLLRETLNEKENSARSSYYDLVKKYLRDGETEKALTYVEEKLSKANLQENTTYTNILPIDIILDYKISETKKHQIHIDLDLDIDFCPLEDNEICAILGCLLDNAIEATIKLPQEQRRIAVSIKTSGKILLLEVKNPYIGKRKKFAGRYMTTKPDKEIHGFGLISIEQIISRYHGILKVTDNGSEFKASVTV